MNTQQATQSQIIRSTHRAHGLLLDICKSTARSEPTIFAQAMEVRRLLFEAAHQSDWWLLVEAVRELDGLDDLDGAEATLRALAVETRTEILEPVRRRLLKILARAMSRERAKSGGKADPYLDTVSTSGEVFTLTPRPGGGRLEFNFQTRTVAIIGATDAAIAYRMIDRVMAEIQLSVGRMVVGALTVKMYVETQCEDLGEELGRAKVSGEGSEVSGEVSSASWEEVVGHLDRLRLCYQSHGSSIEVPGYGTIWHGKALAVEDLDGDRAPISLGELVQELESIGHDPEEEPTAPAACPLCGAAGGGHWMQCAYARRG